MANRIFKASKEISQNRQGKVLYLLQLETFNIKLKILQYELQSKPNGSGNLDGSFGRKSDPKLNSPRAQAKSVEIFFVQFLVRPLHSNSTAATRRNIT